MHLLQPVRAGVSGNLIVVTSERNEVTKRKELTTFTYDTSRCMFCGLCEDACPVDALELTQDFEMATLHPRRPDLGPADARRGAQAHSIQMLIDTILFYIFAVLVLGGGILTITRRNAVHSAISLIVSLLGVAGLYLLQQAEFLFAVQIVLYVGGIMVLFLFVIMLVNLDQAAKERQFNRQWMIALVAVALVGAEIGYFIYQGQGLRSTSRSRCVPERRPDWAIRKRSPTRCSPNTCCRLKSLRSCCWWRWWVRW